jgi:hypothetical protein
LRPDWPDAVLAEQVGTILATASSPFRDVPARWDAANAAGGAPVLA